MSLYSVAAGTTPDSSILGQGVSPVFNESFPDLAQGVGKSLPVSVQSSQGHNINKQVHFDYKVTHGADTKTPFYDSAPPQGEFIFGRDSIQTLNGNSPVNAERSDPFLPIMEARGVFAWNAHFAQPRNRFPTLAAAWEYGLSLKFLGTLTAFEKESSMGTICVSRNAFNVINHWAPDIQPGMYAWFHLEVRRTLDGHFMLRLQPRFSRLRGPIAPNYANVYDVPIATYKVGNALASDEIAYGAIDRVNLMDDFHLKDHGMPTKMLKPGNARTSDNWVDMADDAFSHVNYTNKLESKPRIPMFAVRGSIWGSTS